MPEPLRVAYTFEQCWHDIPGGSASAAIRVAERLAVRDDVDLVGVAGRHRHPPLPAFTPPVGVKQLAFGRPLLYETWNRFGMPHVERVTGEIDVCHSTIAIPAATRAAHVVTVHDLAFVHTPERFTAHGVRVMRAGLERCRTARLVLCPSEATRRDLIDAAFDDRRIRVVPWGVTSVPVVDDDRRRVRRHYDLPERFVLFVGTIEPRKNLARLAEAVARLTPSIPLVIAGADGWGSPPETVGDTRFLGFVATHDLSVLYDLATVFAYPSLHEGFGLPVLEAMAQGAPVVTSRGTATEEVAGDGAELVDPTDVDSIRLGLIAALADPGALADRGRARAAEFSWDAASDATVAAYREAVA